jgi:hypothetical protein
MRFDKTLLTAAGIVSFMGVCATAAAEYRLPTDARLYRGQRIVAPSCYYRLDMQWDGNLVSYTSGDGVVWKTDTSDGEWLTVQSSDDNTVLYTGNFYSVWSTGTCGGRPITLGCSPAHPYLAVQDDGNTVVYDGTEDLWDSGTAGTSLGQSTCNMQTSYTRVWDGFQFTGTEIWEWETAPYGHPVCAEWCANDPSCLGWSWDGGVSTMCHAYSGWSGSTSSSVQGVTSGRVFREFCSPYSEDTCDAHGAACERVGGHDLCRWESAQSSSACASTLGLWTPAGPGFAANNPGAVPPDAAGACITQIENLSCTPSEAATCASRGATCERAFSTSGVRRDLCRWHHLRTQATCALPGLWTTADSSFAAAWPTAVPAGWSGACITQVQNIH